MSFTGGKLKLKGQDAGTKKKKKKKSSGDEKALALVEGAPSNAVKVRYLPKVHLIVLHAQSIALLKSFCVWQLDADGSSMQISCLLMHLLLLCDNDATQGSRERCKFVQETPEGYVLDPHAEVADRRTAAEKRYDEMQAKREREMATKMAAKSHRERVNEFNAYLQNLSEHHDIPKVGPG